jgi:sugar phosphate isomerase/epimerase
MRKPFKLGLNIDNLAMKPPLELAPGWDTAEFPITELLLPYDSEEAWQAKLAEMRSWTNQPPFVAASHWLWDERITGDKITPFEELERQAELACRRLAQVADSLVAGVWGNFFPVPEGFSRTTAIDQALTYWEMAAQYAEKYGVLIALEPTCRPDTIFPRYTDGIDFVKRLGKPCVRLMADMNYFMDSGEPFEDIALEPDFCLHAHIQGEKYQPNVGDSTDKILRFFRVLRDMGYERTVSSAHPWIATEGETFSYRVESTKTLAYLQQLRDQVYAE